MATFIRIPGVNPPSTRPRVDLADVILTAGSLALYEAGHPSNPMIGVPDNLALMPNIALKEANALIPSATEATLAAQVSVGSQISGVYGKWERTEKGGLHGLVSKAAINTNTHAAAFLQTPILNYMLTNISNDYFISYWGRTTRDGAASQAYSAISFSTQGGGNELLYSLPKDSNIYPTGANKLGGAREPAGSHLTATPSFVSAVPTPVYLNVGVSAYTGTVTKTAQATVDAKYAKVFGMGLPPGIFSGAGSNNSSEIHYRTYIEDLTVSGRTYAEAAALDRAEYGKQVLTAGGRYYGDTFTDPATIP